MQANGMIGHFRIESLLGEGGMGTVYKAIDTRFNRPVALKQLHQHLRHDDAVMDRFKTEAVIQARLRHPNIVTVYDFLIDEEVAAIVMEYVNGPSLDRIIQSRGALPEKACIEIMRQILEALAEAHTQGLVHRDIKPSNVLVEFRGGKPTAKITDFGVAKVLGTEKMRTATSARMGTLCYMSPEQVRSPKLVNHRSDIYSLGAMLYEMVSGTLPFEADSEFEVMRRIIAQSPRSPSLAHPGVSPTMERIILTAMAKDPERRYQSCVDFGEALSAASRPVARPPRPVPRVPEPPPCEAPPRGEPTPHVKRDRVSSGTAQQSARAERKAHSRWFLIPGAIIVGVIVVVIVGLVVSLPANRAKKSDGAPPSWPAANRGNLVVNINRDAMAVLDLWQVPDGGQRPASTHRFTGLEPRTYRLTVFKEGLDTSSLMVSVHAGETTVVDVVLH